MIAERTFETRIDLSSDQRQPVIELLNQQLADLFDLYSQTKQAHWNVKGAQFIGLHELFDKLAGELSGFVDLVAERVTTLGGVAMGTARMAAQQSRLPEYDVNVVDSMPVVDAMARRFAVAAAGARSGIEEADDHHDADTADVLTEVSRGLDKALWFLEAHLQGHK